MLYKAVQPWFWSVKPSASTDTVPRNFSPFLTNVCAQKTSARLIDTHLSKCRKTDNLVLCCYIVFTVWVASVYLEAAAQDTGCSSFECFQCWSWRHCRRQAVPYHDGIRNKWSLVAHSWLLCRGKPLWRSSNSRLSFMVVTLLCREKSLLTYWAARFWICSIFWMFFLWCGSHIGEQYSSCGHTKVL